MNLVKLTNQTSKGEKLEAIFCPEKGMNLFSYRKGEIEVIDQSTKPQFEERYAGLGPIIGPHFYRRNPGTLPVIKDESLFPHIARMKEKGVDPFSHGIGRYAPWKASSTETTIKGILTGKDEWNGVSLAYLEGQNFKMEFNAELTSEELKIELSVVSDYDSIVGIHYYYHLPKGRGKVISDVKDHYYDGIELKKITSDWNYNEKHILTYDLNRSADYAFHPFLNALKGSILLDAESYQLKTQYESESQENSWQLYHPADASYVCIEPVSSQSPRRPNLTVSAIKISLQIL